MAMFSLAVGRPEEERFAESEEIWSDSSQSSSDSARSVFLLSKSVLYQRFKEDFASFGLADLQQMNFMAMLSSWHTIALWLSACVLVCEVLQKLLKGYVLWMEIVLKGDGSVENHLMIYLSVLLRCWFVVLFYSDLARFCFWLARDAWRPDCFEGYRRAVCGLGEGEMISGALHYDVHGMPRGWPEKGLTRLQRCIDTFMQVFIFFSFDVWPFIAFFSNSSFWGESINLNVLFSALTSHAGTVGLLHVCIWKFAWLCTDLSMKYKGFKTAWRHGTNEHGLHFEDEDGGASPVTADDEEAEDDGKGDIASAVVNLQVPEVEAEAQETFLRSRGSTATSQALTVQEVELLMQRLRVATDLNICVKLCKVLRVVTPPFIHLTLIITGIYLRRPLIVLLGLVMVGYHVGVGAMYIARVSNSIPSADKCSPCCRGKRQKKLAWSLQAWGEECCGLEYEVQLQRRLIFVCMVGLQAALFAVLGWHFYTACCVVLVILQLQQLTVFCQIPWGWLCSLVEAGLYFFGTALLAFSYLPTKKQAFETMLFVLAHQMGLARKTYYGVSGYKVVRLVISSLFVVLFIVLTVTTLSVDTTVTAGDDYSMVCKNCTYYRVPYVQQKYATGLACPAWFHLGNRKQKMSLSDFGLFSAIAYESADTIENALALFFPGWQLVYSKRVDNKTKGEHDWTTFFEIRSPYTTVFVVRGTSTALDALNDMIIWMPAAVMQAFNFLGPDMLAPVAQAIGWLSMIFGHLDNTNYKRLQRHVIETMKKDPHREYYIAGHSLGGGLAKIVAIKALVHDLQLPAVTFMSPGLLSTQYLVEDNTLSQMTASWLRDHTETVTVMPENDIVSRIDGQTGQVVPIGCQSGSPLNCHLMGLGLCEIFKECGSGRKDEAINLPCGICPMLPCVEGVYQKDFPTKFHVWDEEAAEEES